MSDLRTPEVEDLLRVFAALDDEDTVYTLLEDLFTIREIKETSGASATTIARVSKGLSYGSGGYNAALTALDDVRAASR